MEADLAYGPEIGPEIGPVPPMQLFAGRPLRLAAGLALHAAHRLARAHRLHLWAAAVR
ncbi:hypothetical protein [Microbispora hainanensis]|uniref:hypothetical protein n=1 Tax=Microbispora hainanensis TaxID=568844 RepID=UPI00142F027C|nr:hypothetical protein [Microbispora hainanensis]